jgi:hypothetical protein
MENTKVEPCEKEKKEYDACYVKWFTINQGLCHPEKTWYELCVKFESQKLNVEKLKSNANPK